MSNHLVSYTPPATVRDFIRDYTPGELFFNWILGPVGCLPAESEYLTPTGWKRMDAYAPGDPVAVWRDGEVYFEPAEHVHHPATGPEAFYAFDSGSLEMVLSPEHRVLYQDYLGRLRVCTAAEMAAHPSKRTVPTTFRLAREDASISDAEIRLRVAFAADGSIPAKGQQVTVCVRKERKKARLRELLAANQVTWREAVYPERPTETTFWFADGPLCLVKNLDFVWGLSSRQLTIVVDECTRWDGLNEHAERRFYTTDPRQAEAIQFAAHATGLRATLGVYDDPRNPAWNTMHVVYIRTGDNPKNRAMVRGDTTRVTQVPASDGRKYCFHTSTGFFVARHNGSVFVTGNSGKTTGIFFKLAFMAALQAPSPRDGVRRSRAVIVRNTMPQLRDTTITSWNYWFKDGQAGSWRAQDSKFVLRFNDVECEVLFRPLDTPDDVQRVLSLEVTFAILDEFVQIDKAIVEALSARCGRYPPAMDGGATNWGMWGASNPGNEDSWWHDKLEEPGAMPTNWRYFKQPSGFSAYAENVENLPGGTRYYTSLADGKSDHWVKQFIEVEWGYSLDGTPVLKTFQPQIHVNKTPLLFNPRLPLVAGFDPGLGGSALIFGQMDHDGRLRVLSELVQAGYGADRLCSERLRPHLRLRYPDAQEFFISPDPAANSSKDSDERSVVDVLKQKHKFVVRFPDMNNRLETRVQAIEFFSTRITPAGPALVIDPSCRTLIRALATGWRYKRRKGDTEDTAPEPDKNKYSHPADAFGYLCKWFANTDPRYASDKQRRAALPQTHAGAYHAR